LNFSIDSKSPLSATTTVISLSCSSSVLAIRYLLAYTLSVRLHVVEIPKIAIGFMAPSELLPSGNWIT
jgi:hypothetical protein